MKPHPEMTIEELLKDLLGNEFFPEKVGESTSDADRLAAQVKLHELVAAGKIMFHCAGCDVGINVTDAAICACGGFICPACCAVEEEGTCTHERPAYLPK